MPAEGRICYAFAHRIRPLCAAAQHQQESARGRRKRPGSIAGMQAAGSEAERTQAGLIAGQGEGRAADLSVFRRIRSRLHTLCMCNPTLYPVPSSYGPTRPTVAGPVVGEAGTAMAPPGAAVAAPIAASECDAQICYTLCNRVTQCDTYVSNRKWAGVPFLESKRHKCFGKPLPYQEPRHSR